MASLNLLKLSLMWSRRFLSRALWWARLSLETLPRWLKQPELMGLANFHVPIGKWTVRIFSCLFFV
jgi:hypothetical protein